MNPLLSRYDFSICCSNVNGAEVAVGSGVFVGGFGVAVSVGAVVGFGVSVALAIEASFVASGAFVGASASLEAGFDFSSEEPPPAALMIEIAINATTTHATTCHLVRKARNLRHPRCISPLKVHGSGTGRPRL